MQNISTKREGTGTKGEATEKEGRAAEKAAGHWGRIDSLKWRLVGFYYGKEGYQRKSSILKLHSRP